MRSLLAQLGAVCDSCSNWNAPGITACGGCDSALPVAEAIHAAAGSVARPPLAPDDSTPCAGCGRALPPDLHFCPTCGTRLATRSTPGPSLQPGKVRLLLLRGLGPTATGWPLATTETTIGRGACTLRFPTDDTVPPHAATLVFRAGRLVVRDMGSASVFVQLRRPEPVAAGTCFAVGDQLLRFTGRIGVPAGGSSSTLPFGCPIPAGNAPLRIERIHMGGVVGAAWLRQAPVQIGRATGDLRFPEDPFVSSRHCELEAHPDGALLRDLDSSNGTFILLPAGQERELVLGDTLRIGRSILRVEAQD